MQDVQAKPAASQGDPAAGLDSLIGEAQKIESSGQQQQQAAEQKQEQQAVDTLEADLLSALDMAAAPAQPAMWWLTPEQFDALWGKKVRQAIAESGAVIMRRHGLSIGGLMGQYGPYIGLVAVLGPSVAGTVAVYKAEKQKQISQAGATNAATP